MHLSLFGTPERSGVSRPAAGQPGNASGGNSFASLIEAQSGVGNNKMVPPVGQASATGMVTPVGTVKSVDSASIQPMVGSFSGNASMLEHLAPVKESGGEETAAAPAAVDPNAPPSGAAVAETVIDVAKVAAAFTPLGPLMLLV